MLEIELIYAYTQIRHGIMQISISAVCAGPNAADLQQRGGALLLAVHVDQA